MHFILVTENLKKIMIGYRFVRVKTQETTEILGPEELFAKIRRFDGKLRVSVFLKSGRIISGPVEAVVDQTVRIGQRLPVHFDDLVGGKIEAWTQN